MTEPEYVPEHLTFIPDELSALALAKLEELATQLMSGQSVPIPDFNAWIWKFAPAMVLALLKKDKTKEGEIAALKLTISRLAELVHDCQTRTYPDIKPIDVEAMLAESRKILSDAASA